MNKYQIVITPGSIMCCAIIAVLIYVFIVATGQTFGQRAAEIYPYGSQEWNAEVHRLATKGDCPNCLNEE